MRLRAKALTKSLDWPIRIYPECSEEYIKGQSRRFRDQYPDTWRYMQDASSRRDSSWNLHHTGVTHDAEIAVGCRRANGSVEFKLVSQLAFRIEDDEKSQERSVRMSAYFCLAGAWVDVGCWQPTQDRMGK
ncbi:hypothetical protein BD309DRAFT_259689 [Dichomitus squalens]|nr:hypothetical protein BD309DRAFT_259689 [Dichomitus squalens]